MKWHLIPAILACLYEALARIIPTSKTWSITGKVIDILQTVSNKLDNKTGQ